MFKKLKKLFMFLLVLPVSFVFGACKNNDNNDNNGSKPPVVTPPGGSGGENPAPQGDTYSVEFDYALPAGYELIENSSVTKNVGETVSLPTIADANLREYFLGWYNEADDLKVDAEMVSGAKDETVSLVAKWNESALKTYYYTPGLTFAVATDLQEATIASVTGYSGTATKLILPKIYKFDESTEHPVRMIAQNCFNNSDVTNVNYSSDGLIIGKNAFANTEITSFDFSKVLFIDEYAFYGSKLQSVELGALVQNVSDFAFYDCEQLETVDLSRVSIMTKINDSTFERCSALKNVTLSSSIKTVGELAFSECVSLESADFVAGVQTIETQAFKGCTAIASVTISSGTTSISATAFEGCEVENLSIYNLFAHTDFHNYSTVFGNLANAKTLNILGSEVTKIPSNYFYGASTLEKIVIANSVVEIGEYAFAGCLKLADITFPENLDISKFYANAVQETAWYNSLNKITYVGKNLFFVPSTTTGEVVIQDGTKAIADSAFSYKRNVTSIKIPASLEIILDKAFLGCTGLQTVTIENGSSLKTIGREAFKKCSALTQINLEVCDGLTTIKSSAFTEAFVPGETTVVTLPKNLETIEEGAFLYAKISAFEVVSGAVNFAAEDGVLFNNTKTTLVLYPEEKTADVYSVPASVTLVKNYAFSNNPYINIIDLNSNLVFEKVGSMSNAIYNIRQALYILADSQEVTFKPGTMLDVSVCYQLTSADVEWTANEDTFDFVVKEDTEYEFVTGTYFVVIEGETDRYFVLDVNVSGETITINSTSEISSYFA